MHAGSPSALEQWHSVSDEEIAARVVDGQTALFEVLMRRHNQRLYRAARAILRNDAEAEDVVQQAYVNAYVHLRQFEDRARLATWLTRITVNEALARARQRGRYEVFDDTQERGDTPMMTSGPIDPERQAFARELGSLLEASVDALPDGQREVFMLRDIEGLSTLEAAACLDLGEDAVKTRLSRARARLRRELFERAGLAVSNAFTFERPRCDRLVAAVMSRIAD